VAGEGAVRWKITVKIWKSGTSTVKYGRRRNYEVENYC
jgi:hypothetical protein